MGLLTNRARASRRCCSPRCDDFVGRRRVPICRSCRFALLVGLVLGLLLGLASHAGAQVPRAAVRYQRALVANVHLVWGLDGPVATMAAQVHQESGWNPTARSAFASGLAQFTPATADDMARRYAADLGSNQPLNPSWALRALARYDRQLFDRALPAATPCDRWAFTLAAYNGGAGGIEKDRRLARAAGADPARWWGHVERFSPRAAWAIRENRAYPRVILLRHQPRYAAWGPSVACPGVA